MDAPPSSRRLAVPLTVGAFGKLPGVGDFVRVGAASELTRAFEEWLHQGVQYAHDKRGKSWKPAFLAGNTYAFVFRAKLAGEKVGFLAGVLKPSQDSVGRAFPIAVYSDLPADMPSHLWPQLLGDFLDHAVSMLERASTMTSASELQEALRVMSGIDNAEDGRNGYAWWSRATRLSDAFRAIYGTDDLAQPAYALDMILEMAKPFRDHPVSNTPLAVRLPTGALGVAGATLWLDAIRSAMRWQTTMSTFFWYFDGAQGEVVAQLGRTPSSSLIELWLPDPRNESMCNLLQGKPWGDSMARLPSHVVACLRQPHATVADLLHALWS